MVTFETDPDLHPSPHPHVYLTVNTVGLDGVRLNPRMLDIQRWREGFAEPLREHGIAATTTSRIHRTIGERWKVQHLYDQTTKVKRLDGQQRQTPLSRTQREMMHRYEHVMKTLARSDRGDDRQLAADLVRYLGGQGRTPETERYLRKDRER